MKPSATRIRRSFAAIRCAAYSGPRHDGLVGYSPIAMAKNAIGMAIACEEYGAKFFANGATPGGIFGTSGTIKDPLTCP